MGVLTDHLTRLRNEVLALRSGRQDLIHDLQRETEDRRADVSRTLADFSKGLGAVARRTKADRLGSISGLKRAVTDLLTDVRTDLSGIQQAWLALGTPSRRAVEELENQARREAAADVEISESETRSKLPLVDAKGEKRVRKKRKP